MDDDKNSIKAKLENAAIPAFQRALKEKSGNTVEVKIDFDSFAFDEAMLRLVGSEALPAMLSVLTGPDGGVFGWIGSVGIALDNARSQAGVVREGDKLLLTITNKTSEILDNVKFSMAKFAHAAKQAEQ